MKHLLSIGLLALMSLAAGRAWAQPRLCYVDMTAIMNETAEASIIQAQLDNYRQNARNVLQMQYRGLRMAVLPEDDATPKPQSLTKVDFIQQRQALRTEMQQRLDEAKRVWNLYLDSLISPLEKKVAAAMEAVRIEQGMDTVLNASRCPFDITEGFINIDDWSVPVQWPTIWDGPNFDEVFASAPCLMPETVLYVGKDAIDIGPAVREKLGLPKLSR